MKNTSRALPEPTPEFIEETKNLIEESISVLTVAVKNDLAVAGSIKPNDALATKVLAMMIHYSDSELEQEAINNEIKHALNKEHLVKLGCCEDESLITDEIWEEFMRKLLLWFE